MKRSIREALSLLLLLLPLCADTRVLIAGARQACHVAAAFCPILPNSACVQSDGVHASLREQGTHMKRSSREACRETCPSCSTASRQLLWLRWQRSTLSWALCRVSCTGMKLSQKGWPSTALAGVPAPSKVCLPACAAAAAAAAALPEPRCVLPEHGSASAAHLHALGHVLQLVGSGLKVSLHPLPVRHRHPPSSLVSGLARAQLELPLLERVGAVWSACLPRSWNKGAGAR